MAQHNDDADRQLQAWLDANPIAKLAFERRIANAAAMADAAEARADAAEARVKTLKYVWLLQNRCAIQARRASGLRFCM